MAEEDEGGREDRLLIVGHDEVVALVLPHQIRNGLHLQIHIAGKTESTEITLRLTSTRHYSGHTAGFSPGALT